MRTWFVVMSRGLSGVTGAVSTHDRVEKVYQPRGARRRTLPGDRKEEFPYGERTFQPKLQQRRPPE